jgi:hypothetical protein
MVVSDRTSAVKGMATHGRGMRGAARENNFSGADFADE